MASTQTIITAQLPLVGTTRITFYDIAFEIYDFMTKLNEFERQQKIKHLGKISDVISCLNHTRYEYLLLQCFFTDLFENTYKGTPIAAGTISLNGVDIPSNSILKSWFLLSNFGHGINTIADEKTLLLFSNERKGFRNNLINCIKDPSLKAYAQEVIDNYDYRNFHHVISLWRLENEISERRVIKRKSIDIYKLLLINDPNPGCNSEKLRSLKSIYKILRYISIIALDSHNAHLPFSLNLLSTLTSIDAYEKRFQPKSIIKILNPLLSILYEDIYLDRFVITKTREYEVNSLNVCKSSPAKYKNYDQLIKNSIKCGLTTQQPVKLTHFTRYFFSEDFKFEKNLLNEYRLISTVKRNCPNVEASLDYNPISRTKYVDYFISNHFTREDLPILATNIATIFEKQINNYIVQKESLLLGILATLKKDLINHGLTDAQVGVILKSPRKEVFSLLWGNLRDKSVTSFKEFISSLILFFINPKFTLEIKPTVRQDETIGIKLKNTPLNTIERNTKKLISNTSDPDRQHELLHAKSSACRKFDGYVLCYLSRIEVYDLSKPPNKRNVTDIDSVVIKFNERKFIIEFNETKNQNRGGIALAKKELRKNVYPILNGHSKGKIIQSVTKYGAKIKISI